MELEILPAEEMLDKVGALLLRDDAIACQAVAATPILTTTVSDPKSSHRRASRAHRTAGAGRARLTSSA